MHLSWLHIVFTGIAGFCFGKAAGLAWSDVSAKTWWLAGVVVLILNFIPVAYTRFFLPWKHREGPQFVFEWAKKNISGLVIAVLVLIIIALLWPSGRYNLENQQAAIQAYYQNLRTRPVCSAGCTNFKWIVETCGQEAIDIGDLTHVREFNPTSSTNHFRECLIDKGFSWEPCSIGEMDCYLFRYASVRLGERPSVGKFKD